VKPPSPELIAAAHLEACRNSFEVFAQRAFRILEPGTAFEYNWHIGCISAHLESSFRGEIPDLIMNIPPRFLKSVLVAQLYPAWVMGREPWHQFIGASYAHTLAERNVVKARQVMQDDFYRLLFPQTQISTDQNQKDYFTTTKAGQYKGTGIGGTLTGFGATTIVCDDLLNPKEGMSDTIRRNTNEELRSTIFSRFNDRRNRRFIMIMQRIHDDDPTGNLMRDGGYHLVKLPAEAHQRIQIDLGHKRWIMEQGDLLDAKRVPKPELEKIRTDLGEANYVAQYLQEPAPLGGGEFRVEWLQYYQPDGVKPKDMNLVILVDPSGGESVNRKRGKLSDWTAMLVIGLAPDRNRYILDIVRDRLNPTQRVHTLFTLHKKWSELSGKSPKVGYEKYGMMTDTHYIHQKQREDGYNFPLIELGGAMQKEERIRRLIPDMQNGAWWAPASLPYVDSEGRRFDLVEELKNEFLTFPRSRFDDMSDALSRVYEDDLLLSFPKPRASMVQRAIGGASLSNTDRWEDW
jgi:predicted phage terminase large subunit-like protein